MRRRNQVAERLDKSFWQISEAEMTAFAVVPHFASEWTYNEEKWNAYGRKGRKKASENMSRLADFLKSRGIGLSIAVYPWPDQILNDPAAPRHRKFWANWAQERNVAFVDLFPLFTAGNPYDVLGKYFLQNGVHWNAAGHIAVAEEFMRQFKLKN